jgi:hypothetical protein
MYWGKQHDAQIASSDFELFQTDVKDNESSTANGLRKLLQA